MPSLNQSWKPSGDIVRHSAVWEKYFNILSETTNLFEHKMQWNYRWMMLITTCVVLILHVKKIPGHCHRSYRRVDWKVRWTWTHYLIALDFGSDISENDETSLIATILYIIKQRSLSTVCTISAIHYRFFGASINFP